jgi:hypothetical protein
MKKSTLKNKKEKMNFTAQEVDRQFDEAREDILQHFDTEKPFKRVLVDFPNWMLDYLDKEAEHLGLSRQAIIKTWLNDRIRNNEKKAG